MTCLLAHPHTGFWLSAHGSPKCSEAKFTGPDHGKMTSKSRNQAPNWSFGPSSRHFETWTHWFLPNIAGSRLKKMPCEVIQGILSGRKFSCGSMAEIWFWPRAFYIQLRWILPRSWKSWEECCVLPRLTQIFEWGWKNLWSAGYLRRNLGRRWILALFQTSWWLFVEILYFRLFFGWYRLTAISDKDWAFCHLSAYFATLLDKSSRCSADRTFSHRDPKLVPHLANISQKPHSARQTELLCDLTHQTNPNFASKSYPRIRSNPFSTFSKIHSNWSSNTYLSQFWPSIKSHLRVCSAETASEPWKAKSSCHRFFLRRVRLLARKWAWKPLRWSTLFIVWGT